MKYLRRFNESNTETIEDCLLELTDLPYNFKYEENIFRDNEKGDIKLVGQLWGEQAFFYLEAEWDGELKINKDSISNSEDGILSDQRKPASIGAIQLQKELLYFLPFVLRKLNRDIIEAQTIDITINCYSINNEGAASVNGPNTDIVILFNY